MALNQKQTTSLGAMFIDTSNILFRHSTTFLDISEKVWCFVKLCYDLFCWPNIIHVDQHLNGLKKSQHPKTFIEYIAFFKHCYYYTFCILT